MTFQRALLADVHGTTHWFVATVMPTVGRNGKPACNYGERSHTIIITTHAPPVPWATCLWCAGHY